jgi:hypothetical protein
MLWLLVLLLILAIVAGYLAFMPWVLEVDSTLGVYRVRFQRIASAVLRIRESSLIADVTVVGWKRQIDLLQPRKKSQSKEHNEKSVTKQARKRHKMSLHRIWALLRTFKVNTCVVVADTGDMPLNGILYPVFYGLSVLSGKTFRISFNNENAIKLEINNTIARLLWAYVRSS